MGAEISQLKQEDLVKPIPTLAKLDPDGKLLTKSHSSYTHFSDYSMFPDRFNEKKSAPQAIGLGQGHLQVPHHEEHHDHYSDYALYTKTSSPAPSQSGSSLPSGVISRYNFRLRRSSESEQEIAEELNSATPKAKTQRAQSLKPYYFDFSLIPDKDPHCVQDECKQNNLRVPLIRIKEEQQYGQSAPTTSEQQIEAMALRAKRVRKTSEPRYGFFDYSMIPDKDPRLFARANANSSSDGESK